MTTPHADKTIQQKTLVSHAATSLRERVTAKTVLFGIVAVAVILRLAVAVYMGNVVYPLPGIFDQVSYNTLARQLLAGQGFTFPAMWWPATRAGEPTAHWSFLYTSWVAGVYMLSGGSPLVVRVLQALVAGVLQPWLTWRIGNRLFGQRAGLVAAALVAVYAYFVYYAGAIMTESFYILGILWALDLATAWEQRHATTTSGINARFWFQLGVALGVTVLFRQVFLLFIPLLSLWFLGVGIFRADVGRRLDAASRIFAGLVIAGVVTLALILPWTIRNYLAFDRFVLLNTNAGYAFFWGNHPIYGTHFVGILPPGGPSYQDLIPKELLPLDEAALDQALLERGIGFITADPQRYVLLSLSRAEEYFKIWPSDDSSLASNIGRGVSAGILAPFMLYGIVLSIRRRKHTTQASLILLYMFVVAYTGIHLLSWALIRYRLPVDAVLLLFAAVGIVQLTEYIRKSR